MPLRTPLPPIKLSARSKSLLKEARENIATAMAEFQRMDGGLTRMKRDEDALALEVEELQKNTDYSDTATVADLEAKRSQLSLLRGKLPALEEKIMPQFRSVQAALQPLNTVMREAMLPYINALELEIARTLAEFEPEWSFALAKARHFPIIHSVSSCFISCGWGNGGLHQADRALHVIDELLAGRNPWKFEGASEPKGK